MQHVLTCKINRITHLCFIYVGPAYFLCNCRKWYNFIVFVELLQKIILPTILIGVGLLAVLGHVLENRSLTALGYATAASPLPLPFTDAGGFQESFAHTYNITIKTTAGKIVTFQPHDVSLSGPHKRKIPYLSSVVFSSKNYPLVESILTYTFCGTDNPIRASFGIESVAIIYIHVTSNTPGNPGSWSRIRLCIN
ncbi:MAG: hypothetical protein ACI92I_000933 [Acidimicrobiales bacterium]|jgi:hypothetical protein